MSHFLNYFLIMLFFVVFLNRIIELPIKIIDKCTYQKINK